MDNTKFFELLSSNEILVRDYLLKDNQKQKKIKPEIFENFTLSYINNSGKKLRPAVLMLCCEALGGDKSMALPVSAAVEIFHTWTLVHDDIIDNDPLRRGVETVHIQAQKYGQNSLGFGPSVAEKYGKDIAMLIGDIQQGWSVSLISKNSIDAGLKHEVALHLISKMEVDMLRTLVEGEMLDVDFGLYYEIEDLSEEMILDMLWKKTGVFYEFCGMAGAMIALNTCEDTEEVRALSQFCSLCGTAFQVYDDILGLVGNEKKLGKPVGSDIREGKKTILIKEAIKNATDTQRSDIMKVLGDGKAAHEDISKTIALVKKLGGVERAEEICRQYVNKARPYLDIIPDTVHKENLVSWSEYIINRNY